MITDYSSVLFDYDDFRKGQYKEGYFDFSKQKLGVVCNNLEKVLNEVGICINNDFILNKESEKYIDSFFVLNDNKNCERTFEEIMKL